MTRMKDIAKVDRPREKLIKYGSERLSNSELLAIILRVGGKGTNAVELARRILSKFCGQKLTKATHAQLKNIPGLGATKACQIVACFELGKRLLRNKKTRLYLSPKDIFNELKDIRDNKKEHFVVFYLDAGNQEIRREIISIGTLNSNLVHPREVFEPAVKNLAAQVIIAHNHPSNDPQPSEADLEITRRLISAGKILGIEIVDHIIVTNNHYLSFKEKGILKF